MTYRQFRALAKAHHWRIADLRGERSPSRALLAAVAECGLERWALYVQRLARRRRGREPARLAY